MKTKKINKIHNKLSYILDSEGFNLFITGLIMVTVAYMTFNGTIFYLIFKFMTLLKYIAS